MPQSEGPRRVPLWLALVPALTTVSAVGGLGNEHNLFPTWAEVLLLVGSVTLLVAILAVNVWQRRNGQR